MIVYLKKRKKSIDAIGDFDEKSRRLTVLKGSMVSEDICHSEKFHGARSIEKAREENVKDRIVLQDVEFKSPSTAGNFVTGHSTNGLQAWKAEDGVPLKEFLKGVL